MSSYMVERVLWEICNMPEKAERFLIDAPAHLAQYSLTDNEAKMITDLDVRGLADIDVSQMLLMMTWNVMVGEEKIGEYLERMGANGTPPP